MPQQPYSPARWSLLSACYKQEDELSVSRYCPP
nr:MAG TPA_asm: hypothetical protein [Caudoviricetes sp.]